MMSVPTIAEFREQALDFVLRNCDIDLREKDLKLNSLVITYMAAFAHEVLKLREAGINWRDGRKLDELE
jgi:hypothetical protein